MTASLSEPGGDEAPRDRTAILALVLLIKVVGVVGFVGLLVASQVMRGGEDGWRAAAFVWFAVFGVGYVWVGLKAPGDGMTAARSHHRSHPNRRKRDLPGARPAAVFEEVDALPGPQPRPATD